METIVSTFEPLLERVEEYGKTTFELIKLKSLNKTAAVASKLIYRLVLTIVLLLFITTLTVAVALWLGNELGKNYYGFLAVALFYGVVGVVLFLIHPFIKTRVKNSIIEQLLN